MDGDVLYAILMSFGWLFLVGWLALLLIACGLAFRSDGSLDRSVQTINFASGAEEAAGGVGNGIPWKIHLPR